MNQIMNTNNTEKCKHMTLEQRRQIQDGLVRKMTFKEIAKFIQKDQTTVSKEIKKHLVTEIKENTVRDGNGNPLECKILLKAPFVCNGCEKRSYCHYVKKFYRADVAQEKYRETLIDSRTGVALNRESFYRIDSIVSSGIRNGQHLYHILQSNAVPVAPSTVYRHINKGYLLAGRTELPRAVKFRPRKTEKESYVPRKAKIGRTFEDFNAYLEETGIRDYIEMDTVIGEPGGKVLITFDFTFCNFMFALLSSNKTAGEVSRQITALKEKLLEHGKTFGSFFPLILTDNGGEFSNISAFENDLNGNQETKLFFCDPYKSCQKPHVEKNHTILRDICPKGTSFDSFTQQDVNLIFSHMNSIKRKKLQGKSPYEMLNFMYGFDLAGLLGISNIPAEQVIQSPKLLKLLLHK